MYVRDCCFFFFKQKAAYEMRISYWSSDVCSSDLGVGLGQMLHMEGARATLRFQHRRLHEWPPEGGVATLCRAEPMDRHATQMALSEKLLRALDWQGPALVEYLSAGTDHRSEARLTGHACVSTRRSRRSPSHYTKKTKT